MFLTWNIPGSDSRCQYGLQQERFSSVETPNEWVGGSASCNPTPPTIARSPVRPPTWTALLPRLPQPGHARYTLDTTAVPQTPRKPQVLLQQCVKKVGDHLQKFAQPAAFLFGPLTSISASRCRLRKEARSLISSSFGNRLHVTDVSISQDKMCRRQRWDKSSRRAVSRERNSHV